MIFISGITIKEEELDFSQMMVCPNCEAYGRFNAFMTYTRLSLFFIPIFKWNRKYYLRSSCCNSIFTIDKNIGKDIEKGRHVNLTEDDLTIINKGYRQYRCGNCNSVVDNNFEYCPKCGGKL